MKNVMGKSRKPDNPYLVFESADGWTWKVLKSWQADNRKPYARWFCYVPSPFTFGSGDMGDTYVSDVVEYGSLTYADPSVFPATTVHTAEYVGNYEALEEAQKGA